MVKYFEPQHDFVMSKSMMYYKKVYYEETAL